MQHEITTRHPLLDEQGRLTEPGYATSLILEYDRNAIKAKGRRIKEWDYYLVTCDDFAVALTIDDNSYMGLDSISLLDFRNDMQITTSPMQVLTRGGKNLPPSSEAGDTTTKGKGYSINFYHGGDHRILKFSMEKFYKGKSIKGEIRLENPEQDSMVIATPYKEDPLAFYYNQKIIAMPATGWCEFDGERYEFPEGKSFGLLDWGRGVWTYKNTWYWGAAQGMVDGHRFGWNIGYGFGDTSAASENMLFYDGKAHKLSQVKFNIPQVPKIYTTKGGCCMPSGKEMETVDKIDDFMSPWTFSSDDGRFEMLFMPIMDRYSKTDIKLICSDQHQVFGKFSGRAILDDGTVIEVQDFLGFAEKVYNKW
ncbi:MAG: DUF2804 domain-containing protein [Firmicutes bacterium]|nr:DUF2804 domain-containing protein [Bacillota bacterium]